MYSNMCLVIVVSFLFLSDVINANNVSKSYKHHEFVHHRRRVEKYQKEHPCGEPVETLVPLVEVLFDRKIHANEKMFPDITLLHRCNSYSKCTQLGNQCAEETSEMVDLTFFVTSIDGITKEYVIGHAQNHTSCSCHAKK